MISSSSVLNLTHSMETLTANFSNVAYLEIRSDRDKSWFSVDQLVLNENVSVPEGGTTFAMLGVGLLGMIGMKLLT